MKKFPILNLIIPLLLLLLLHSAKSEENLVRDTLLQFFSQLTNNHSVSAPGHGWNSSSDPCHDRWSGITCDAALLRVQKISLNSVGFAGVFDPSPLCGLRSLAVALLVIDVAGNRVRGENLVALRNCSELRRLDLSSNQFSGGEIQDSVVGLPNLESLDLSRNMISGSLPDMARMPRLSVFRAEENDFSGPVPDLNYSSFSEFNVSSNNLTGPIPFGARGLPLSGFLDNPELCGLPLPRNCSSAMDAESAPNASNTTDSTPPQKGKGVTNKQLLMYIGYVVLAFVGVLLILLYLRKKRKTRRERAETEGNVDHNVAVDESMMKPSFSTVELKANKGKGNKYEYSSAAASAESADVSASVIVLTSPEVNGMRFEDLLKAPAELLGRGSHGSVYKVACEDHGMVLAVKRVKDWPISSGEFRQRMRRLSQVKHRNVLPAVAYYSSGQEKLIVYEFQENGSLFRHIHANGDGKKHPLDWSTRLSIAVTIADALAYMHDELQYDRVPHGNLKSSNILFNKNMETSISEYGLMLVEGQEPKVGILANGALEAAQEDYKVIFKTDTYAFGVVLLELLTGRAPLNEGLDLASWVVAVVREEWTVEVFDKNLIREGINEERMVNLLQIAIRCVAKSIEARPNMRQVALALGAIREEDERSLDVSDLSMTRSFVGL